MQIFVFVILVTLLLVLLLGGLMHAAGRTEDELDQIDQERKSKPTTVCMDCRKLIRPGNANISHGLCPACLDIRLRNLQNLINS